MDERIKHLREILHLTQDKFASRLGIKRGAVANYEVGRNIPADSVVALMCREFHVREEWLRTGNGEIFAPDATSALEALAAEKKLTHGEYILIEKFVNLPPAVRQEILNYVTEVSAALAADDVPATAPAWPNMSPEELHAELDRQIGIEKDTEDKSGVS